MRSVAVRLFSVAFLACVLVASASSVLAQVAGGTITGVVKDQAGAAVSGTAITVTNVETNRQRVVFSSGEGVYAAAGLPPGTYRVDAALSGFRPLRRTGIRLTTGETAQLDLGLTVGDIREQVTVTARRADSSHGDRQSRHAGGTRAGPAAPSQRPQLHPAGAVGSRRRHARKLAAAAH